MIANILRGRIWLMGGLLALTTVLVDSSSLQASFEVRVHRAGVQVGSYSDGDGDGVIATGDVLVSGGGVFNILARSNPAAGDAFTGALDLRFIVSRISGTGTQDWCVTVTDTSYAVIPGVGGTATYNTSFGASLSGSTLPTVGFGSWLNSGTGGGTTNFATAPSGAPGSPFLAPPLVAAPGTSTSLGYTQTGLSTASIGGSLSAPLISGIGSGPFSFTQQYSILFTGTGSISAGDPSDLSAAGGSFSVLSTPAPAGLIIALTALPLLGLGRWLHGRRQAAVA